MLRAWACVWEVGVKVKVKDKVKRGDRRVAGPISRRSATTRGATLSATLGFVRAGRQPARPGDVSTLSHGK
jgi:hypothetical protein